MKTLEQLARVLHGNPLVQFPARWKRVPLADVAVVQNGYAFDSSSFSEVEGIPLIRIRDVGKGQTTLRYRGKFDAKYLVRRGDMLIGMDGDFRVAEWEGDEALLNQRVCRVVPDESLVHHRFLAQVLPRYLAAIQEATAAITVKHLSSKTVEVIPLALPYLEEQRCIAALLDEADRLERLRKEANGKAERILPALFLQMFGDPQTNPMGWDTAPFGDVVRDVSSGQPKTMKRDFKATGAFPIIDQGQSEVAGYVDDDDALFRGELPVIVFGDHTRIFKYADRPFAIGADGVRALQATARLEPLFAYWSLRLSPIPSAGYSRHFKFLREKVLMLPPMERQRRFSIAAKQTMGLGLRQSLAEIQVRDVAQMLHSRLLGGLVQTSRPHQLPPR